MPCPPYTRPARALGSRTRTYSQQHNRPLAIRLQGGHRGGKCIVYEEKREQVLIRICHVKSFVSEPDRFPIMTLLLYPIRRLFSDYHISPWCKATLHTPPMTMHPYLLHYPNLSS